MYRKGGGYIEREGGGWKKKTAAEEKVWEEKEGDPPPFLISGLKGPTFQRVVDQEKKEEEDEEEEEGRINQKSFTRRKEGGKMKLGLAAWPENGLRGEIRRIRPKIRTEKQEKKGQHGK